MVDMRRFSPFGRTVTSRGTHNSPLWIKLANVQGFVFLYLVFYGRKLKAAINNVFLPFKHNLDRVAPFWAKRTFVRLKAETHFVNTIIVGVAHGDHTIKEWVAVKKILRFFCSVSETTEDSERSSWSCLVVCFLRKDSYSFCAALCLSFVASGNPTFPTWKNLQSRTRNI